MPHQSSPITHSVIDNFPNFYESWLNNQQSLLHHLLQSSNGGPDDKKLRLINQVLAHYRRYYDEISKAAGEDVFGLFSAPWLTSYERTLLWICGFRPSIAFRLVEGAVRDLTPEQGAMLEELKVDVRRKERDLTEAMASLQETVAAPPIVGLARWAGRLVDGEICEMESAMEELKVAMEGIVDGADGLRGLTVRKLMEILNSDQTVWLLAAATEFQLRIRRWGLQKDSIRATGSQFQQMSFQN